MTDNTHRAAHLSHLDGLFLGLAHERQRLARATSEHEIALRSVWVSQSEREINSVERFLGLTETDFNVTPLTIEEIFAELSEL